MLGVEGHYVYFLTCRPSTPLPHICGWVCVCVCMCVWGMVRVMWEREADVGGLGLDCCRGGGLAGVGERCRRNERICVCVCGFAWAKNERVWVGSTEPFFYRKIKDPSRDLAHTFQQNSSCLVVFRTCVGHIHSYVSPAFISRRDIALYS